MKMTDSVYNHRDDKVVKFLNDNLDDVDRIMRANFDFYRDQRKKNLLHYIQLAGIAIAPIVALVVISLLLYAVVK